jgi:hypothetical protein
MAGGAASGHSVSFSNDTGLRYQVRLLTGNATKL